MGIYVIQWEGLPYVKIGKADSLTARLGSFRTASPLPVIVRAWYPYEPDSTEDAWHERWAGCHHTLEWFKPDEAMNAWLETLTIASAWGKPKDMEERKASWAVDWSKRLQEQAVQHGMIYVA